MMPMTQKGVPTSKFALFSKLCEFAVGYCFNLDGLGNGAKDGNCEKIAFMIAQVTSGYL